MRSIVLLAVLVFATAQAPMPPDPGLQPFTQPQIDAHEARRLAHEAEEKARLDNDEAQRMNDLAVIKFRPVRVPQPR